MIKPAKEDQSLPLRGMLACVSPVLLPLWASPQVKLIWHLGFDEMAFQLVVAFRFGKDMMPLDGPTNWFVLSAKAGNRPLRMPYETSGPNGNFFARGRTCAAVLALRQVFVGRTTWQHWGTIWGHYLDGFWGLSKSEMALFPLAHHLGGDFDHG